MRYNVMARELVQGLLKRARPTYAPQVRALAERVDRCTDNPNPQFTRTHSSDRRPNFCLTLLPVPVPSIFQRTQMAGAGETMALSTSNDGVGPGRLPMAPGSPARPGRTTLMTITTTTAGPGALDDTAALDIMADMLAAHHLGTRTMRVLKITGTRSAVADLVITSDGTAVWHYHACDGTPPDPARTTAITATLLHVTTPPNQSNALARPGATGSYRTWTSSPKPAPSQFSATPSPRPSAITAWRSSPSPTCSPSPAPLSPDAGRSASPPMAPSPGTPASRLAHRHGRP